MIIIEKNTYFSSLVSKKSKWNISEIIELSKKLLSPFKEINGDVCEPSKEVSMLEDVTTILPYKINCYRNIVNTLYTNKGFYNDDLSINVFNSDSGIDIIAFIDSLLYKGYDINNIKCIRLFSTGEKGLKRALLLLKILYPTLKTTAERLGINEIERECECNSLLTINLFPHTYCLGANIYKEISRIIVNSHYIYSHSIFFENIDSNKMPIVPLLECSFYWEELNKCRFYKEESKNRTISPNVLIEKKICRSCYAIFSNTSIDTLSIDHKFNIVLEDLCPGVPFQTLFNQSRKALFFDRPLKDKDLCDDINDEIVVTKVLDYTDISKSKQKEYVSYTLKRTIEDFPQYNISQGLEDDEIWAHEVYKFYYNAALQGNTQCYNNLGVLESLYGPCIEKEKNYDSNKFKKIERLFTLAANAGDTNAMINLASLYMYVGMHDEAIKVYKTASDNGEAVGSYSMGIVYNFGLYNYIKNEELAIKYYQKCREQYLDGIKTDASNNTPISNCVLNLIILMYQMQYSLCQITKEYNYVSKPSEKLIYAYTVIRNNLSNKASNFFKVMKILDKEDKEPSFITFNRIIALYNGIKSGDDYLKSNKESAFEQLKQLRDTRCPDWPDWQKFIIPKLATWSYEIESSPMKSITYWLESIQVNPDGICAYKTNIALTGKLSKDETKAIWKMFAFGNGCKTCHECLKYDKVTKCCPKAQYYWATKYEQDPVVAKLLLRDSACQGYKPSLEFLAITSLKKEFNPNEDITFVENYAFRLGVKIPAAYQKIIDKFDSKEHCDLLRLAANSGSKKAAAILVEIFKIKELNYEYLYWSLLSVPITEKISILQRITNRNFEREYFKPSTIAEKDLVKFANERASKFLGDKNETFIFLKTLAEFYVRGGLYKKALELYKVAKDKNYDVCVRITELEEMIEKRERERRRDIDYWEDEPYTWEDSMLDALDGEPDAYWNID